MQRSSQRLIRLVLATVWLWGPAISAQLLREDVPELRGIDVSERLGGSVPLNLRFADENGRQVELRDVFVQGKPVVLTLAYYECPMLCTFVLNALSKAVAELDWQPGDEYQMLTVSIDPEETPALAAAKRKVYVDSLNKGDIGDGWRFWVGRQTEITSLAESVGFEYYYDARQDEFAHPAVVFVLTPEGVISRYLYGIDYRSKDLRLSLLEAGEGKIGSLMDRVILFCYHYDPMGKKYTLMAMNVMRLGGLITVTFLGFFLAGLWLRERRNNACVSV